MKKKNVRKKSVKVSNPVKKKKVSRKKTATKKIARKKIARKKVVKKKTATKKSPQKKNAGKKSPTRKTARKKTVARKAATKKSAGAFLGRRAAPIKGGLGPVIKTRAATAEDTSMDVTVEFRLGNGEIVATLLRQGNQIDEKTINTETTVTFDDVLARDVLSLNGTCTGTAKLNTNRTTSPASPRQYEEGPILENLRIK